MPSRRKRKLKIGNLIIVVVSLLVVCAGGFSLIHMITNKKDKTVIRKDPSAISTNEPVETEKPKGYTVRQHICREQRRFCIYMGYLL